MAEVEQRRGLTFPTYDEACGGPCDLDAFSSDVVVDHFDVRVSWLGRRVLGDHPIPDHRWSPGADLDYADTPGVGRSFAHRDRGLPVT